MMSNIDEDTSSRKKDSPLRALKVFCGSALMFICHHNHFYRKKRSLNLSRLLTATSEHKQARVYSAKTSQILWEDWHASTHVWWLSVWMRTRPALCFCGVFFAGSRGVFLEVQTSLKESKIESWERRREVRGGRRLNKQRWWRLPVITTRLISQVYGGRVVVSTKTCSW